MADDSQEDILQFPCDFPIKVMCKAIVDLERTVFEIVKPHAPELSIENIQTRSSSGGKYIGVTVAIKATSRQQLDSIYQALTDHPDVLMSF